MTVLRTDRKHASNCMTEENGVEKVKKRKNFFRSLRFRILIILIILGIVPGVIVTYTMLHNYQNRAVAMLTETVGDQCDILCNLIIRENYLNDTDSEVVNSKLELFSNVYNGRILLADRDFKIVSDTFHTEEGKTLLSSLAVACLKGEETSNYDARSKVLELAVPVQSPDVQQLQGVMLVSVSAVDIAETLAEMEQRGVMLIGSIVVLSVFLAWLLSTILVKPLARVTKAIEDLTDGMLDEEISVPDYTETELITDAFNKMVNRMKILDESRQEFVAELAVAELLALNRQLKFVNNGLCAGRFDHFGAEEFVCHEMTGRTLGLVGTGNIAHRVADTLRAAFDVRVLCWNPRRTAAECAAWGYEQVETLPELFRRSDFVNVSITLCDATRDLINAPVFAAANPELLLVNTSRGGIVNERDLYVALTTGQIRAAASDVFAHEPPASDDPLIRLDNFIATFHIGGSTYESLERVSNRAVDYVFQYTGVAER